MKVEGTGKNTEEAVTDLPDMQNVGYMETAAQPETEPHRTGYTFTGWYTDQDCKEEDRYDFATGLPKPPGGIFCVCGGHRPAYPNRPEGFFLFIHPAGVLWLLCGGGAVILEKTKNQLLGSVVQCWSRPSG